MVGGARVSWIWPGSQRCGAPRPASLPPGSAVGVVFFLHGRGNRAADMITHAAAAAELGLLAVFADQANHGARELSPFNNRAWEQENWAHACDMYGQMVQAANELSLQIGLLPALLDVAFKRVAVVGISQGGHAALLAATAEPRIDVCVAIIGSADYEQNLRSRYERLCNLFAKEGRPNVPTFESLFPAGLAKLVASFDPIRNGARLAAGTRPILMLNGGNDALVPKEGNVALVEQIAPLYEAAGVPSHLRCVIFPDAGHEVTADMQLEVRDWLGVHMRQQQ